MAGRYPGISRISDDHYFVPITHAPDLNVLGEVFTLVRHACEEVIRNGGLKGIVDIRPEDLPFEIPSHVVKPGLLALSQLGALIP